MNMARPKPIAKDLYAELEALPAHVTGQIVNGVLYSHPRPATEHGIASTELSAELSNPFRRGRGGPGGWVFIVEEELHLGDDVLVPDISGWRVGRLPSKKDTSYTVVPPDWICEVASPSTRRLDRLEKLPIYARNGVSHCWYVDPIEKTLEVFILADGTYKLGPTFTDNAPVSAPPFESHTFDLGILWWQPDAPAA
jgi:Uma2 family endonuclease